MSSYYFVYYRKIGVSAPQSLKLFPQSPQMVADGEPLLPRICLAPTISRCLCAIPLYVGVYEYYAYKVDHPFKVEKPQGVFDAVGTGEVWSFEPLSLTLCYKIPMDVIIKYNTNSKSPSRNFRYFKTREYYNISLLNKYLKAEGLNPKP
jgi:hypothetical protein